MYVYWGMQHVPSIQVPCVFCGEILAMDRDNRSLGMEPMCPGCLAQEAWHDDVAPTKLPREVIEWAYRVASEHKRALAIMGN